MTRAFALPLIVISLAIGGFLFVRQAQTSGPTSSVAQQAETQASQAAAATDFSAAEPAVQAYYADNGTYAGLSLPPAFAITVVRADATSYCLQAGNEHLDGPGGQPASGPC
jgi:lipid-binding SYLF domain-containing protein